MSSAGKRTATGCELIADIAEQFGEVRLRVFGSSMIPAVWPGDILIVQRTNPDTFHAGQVVLYRKNNSLVAHRIVEVCGDTLITRGDAVSTVDPPVIKKSVLGVTASVVRHGDQIDLRSSFSQRALAFFARHSTLCLRILVYCNRMAASTARSEAAWTN